MFLMGGAIFTKYGIRLQASVHSALGDVWWIQYLFSIFLFIQHVFGFMLYVLFLECCHVTLFVSKTGSFF